MPVVKQYLFAVHSECCKFDVKRNLCTKRKIVNEYKVYVKKIYDLFVGTVLGLDKSSKHVGFLI